MAVAKRERIKVDAIVVRTKRPKSDRKGNTLPGPDIEDEPLRPSSEPVDPYANDPPEIRELKHDIWQLWGVKRIEDRFLLGKKLRQLQKECAKPGHGTFVRHLKEVGFSVPTAYRYIGFYEKIILGYDVTPDRLSHGEKDEQAVWNDPKFPVEEVPPPSGIKSHYVPATYLDHVEAAHQKELDRAEELDAIEQAALQKYKDEELKRREAAIAGEKEQTERDAKEKGKLKADYRFWIYLPSLEQRKRFFKAWNLIGHKKASRLVVKAILDEAHRHKGKRSSRKRRG